MKLTDELFSGSKRNLVIVCAVVFCMSVIGRLAIIAVTQKMDYDIDLCIYVSGGQLITFGVNPYDHNDGINIRQELKEKFAIYCPQIFTTQERWDYYASSNLPLTLMMFGAIDHFFPGNHRAYRVVFVFIDSLLSAFIVLFVFSVWRLKTSILNLALSAGLGMSSPILLWWGTAMPEDKGTQILLMLLALLYAKERKLLLSAVFLSGAIAFKGLGVFIAPLCAWYIVKEPGQVIDCFKRPVLACCALYAGMTTLITAACFAPYLIDLIPMMQYRLSNELAASSVPNHGSIWRLISAVMPSYWTTAKTCFIVFFISLNVIGVVRKRIGFEVITASTILLFVNIALLRGSMDRMNIGIVIALLILGAVDKRWGVQLGWLYCVNGLVSLAGYLLISGGDREFMDVAFNLIFVTTLTVMLTIRIMRGNLALVASQAGDDAVTKGYPS